MVNRREIWGCVLLVARVGTFLATSATCLAADKAGTFVVTCLEIPDIQRGAGLAVVLQTPSGRTFLYDTGVGYPEGTGWAGDHNTARDRIVPFLNKQGVRSIDGVAISHAHYDHFGGLLWMVDNFPICTLYDSGYSFAGEIPANYVTELAHYEALRKRFSDRSGAYQAGHQGDRLDWDPALEVEVLAPPAGFFSEPHPERRPEKDPPAHYLVNANSLGLRIRYGTIVFLLPGDIQSEDQLQSLLPAVPPEKLRCHVLIAPGHGLHAVPEFAMATRPAVTVASVHARWGRNIRAQKVYGDVGSKVLVTGLDGAVQFTCDGNSYGVELLPPMEQPARKVDGG